MFRGEGKIEKMREVGFRGDTKVEWMSVRGRDSGDGLVGRMS